MARFIFSFLFFLTSYCNVFSSTYYISPSAAGSGTGTQNSPFTFQQAISIAAPGDVFYIAIGDYTLSSSLNFNKNGTETNPIRWVGYISPSDYSALSVDGSSSTVLRNVTNSSNGPVSMSGSYNIFEKIIFQQDYPAKQLIGVGGTGVVLDSCSVKYPSNASSSSNHTVVVSGVGVTFRYSHFYNGSRTIIWVRKNSGTQADFFTMEYCTLTHATNHPPIQIMPATNSTDTATIKRPIVRNCLFIDNPYSDGIYSRYCEQFAFYNNLFIRSSTPMSIDIHTGFNYPTGAPTDTCNSKGGIIAYNTIIENGTQSIYYNVGTNQINFENNIYYNTNAGPYFGRFDSPNNAIYRHKLDYNFYYASNLTFGSNYDNEVIWGNAGGIPFNTFRSNYGQETHTTVNVAPTFANISADDYSPLNASSPQVGKGTPITRANGYWMDITTDFFGNPRDPNNPTVGAIEYNTGLGDIYPPNLDGASLTNATSLRLIFSEPLSPTTAQNISNYSISNGITITSASISGSVVTLTTSEHVAGNYTITVNNVTDLAGNVINPNANSANYNYDPGDVTPPSLQSANLTSATNLVLTFSEALNSSSASNVSNYSISNGISISSASVNGSVVTLTTAQHSAGNYTVTVSNVTDLAGNVINPNANSANYNYDPGDVTPPSLQGANLTSATNLVLTFSEALNSSSASNISNYSISNGISISSASVNGSVVTLTTAQHSAGNYTVTVSNVTDLAGNVINPNANSANYNYIQNDVTPPQVISATIMDSVSLRIIFSEDLDLTSAQNINNYSISGISIVLATLDNNIVTLRTSVHTPGNYTVIVNNVTDIAGNIVDPNSNTAQYTYDSNPNGDILLFPVANVLASVTPEPEHTGDKTLDGKGYFDGDLDSRWAGDTMPEWLVYDLGDIQILNKTKLSFFKWNEGRTYEYTMQVSTDSVTWNTILSNQVSSLAEWTESTVGPINARYIKIIFNNSNQNSWAGLWEAEFYGHLRIPTNVEEETIPTIFVLEQNYPNPFNPSTMIRLHLPLNSNVRIAVYNMLGEFISEVANGDFESGIHEFNFDASRLASGIYIYRVESANFVDSKKMILIR